MIFIGSSEGSDEVAAAQAGVIKKNVVANNIINFQKLTPTEQGCEFVGVNCIDIAGSVPDMLKRKGAERQKNMHQRVLYQIKTGNPPPS